MALETTVHRTILKIGYGITLHGPRALYPVVEVNAAARDKFTCHPHLVLQGFTLQFQNHQGVIGLIMHIETLPPGNPEFIRSFSFHGYLLSWGIMGI